MKRRLHRIIHGHWPEWEQHLDPGNVGGQIATWRWQCHRCWLGL